MAPFGLRSKTLFNMFAVPEHSLRLGPFQSTRHAALGTAFVFSKPFPTFLHCQMPTHSGRDRDEWVQSHRWNFAAAVLQKSIVTPCVIMIAIGAGLFYEQQPPPLQGWHLVSTSGTIIPGSDKPALFSFILFLKKKISILLNRNPPLPNFLSG